MKWEDVLDHGVWKIPASTREKGTAGSLQLPGLALEIIRSQPAISQNPYVFAGRGKGPFNSWSQRKDELDAKLGDMPPWVVHDVRRTARSLMSRVGVKREVAERVLGHAIPGVEGVYDRHHYDEQKGAALLAIAG